MSLVCLLVGPGCLGGVVICVLGASWHIVVCLVCASWWVLGFSGLCHLRLGGLLVHRRMSLVVSWAPLWLRQASCRGPLVHRRVSLVCLWVEPWCLCGFVRCVLSASWDIVVCLVCASWWILGPFGASSFASVVLLGTSSYVSRVPLVWGLGDFGASSGKF